MSDLHTALLEVQRNLPAVPKAQVADTGTFKYRFASLADVHDALLPLLHRNGLVWTVTGDADRMIRGTVTHAGSGEQVVSWWPLPATDDPQRLGSALTYGRRYLLCALVGLVPDEDDDGRAAQAPAKSKAERAADLGVDWSGLVAAYRGDEGQAAAALQSDEGRRWAREHCPVKP